MFDATVHLRRITSPGGQVTTVAHNCVDWQCNVHYCQSGVVHSNEHIVHVKLCGAVLFQLACWASEPPVCSSGPYKQLCNPL